MTPTRTEDLVEIHQLLAKYEAQGRTTDVADYEPKMNVTPNAVALKDD